MSHLLSTFNKTVLTKTLPSVRVGDTVRVYQKIKEGAKFRTQAFEGLIIARKHGSEAGATITVRKASGDTAVERIFPLYLPTIEKIEVVKQSKVRRAKLYYLRGKTSKETRRKLKTKMAEKPTKPNTSADSTETTQVSS
ncbi:MAG: 50S ribosomal protein L19 [bacterium]|nr:50S ribosomal protein L19 [bacterium]